MLLIWSDIMQVLYLTLWDHSRVYHIFLLLLKKFHLLLHLFPASIQSQNKGGTKSSQATKGVYQCSKAVAHISSPYYPVSTAVYYLHHHIIPATSTYFNLDLTIAMNKRKQCITMHQISHVLFYDHLTPFLGSFCTLSLCPKFIRKLWCIWTQNRIWMRFMASFQEKHRTWLCFSMDRCCSLSLGIYSQISFK